MNSGLRLEFDKCVRDFQAALTLIQNESMMESAMDRVWNRYVDSESSKRKLFLCMMTHSKLGPYFRDLPGFGSISYLIKKEIPFDLLQRYLSYPWKNEEFASLFMYLPSDVLINYLNLLPQQKLVHPLLFRIIRKQDLPIVSNGWKTNLKAYSRNELIELIFYLTVDFNEALLYKWSSDKSAFPLPSSFPEARGSFDFTEVVYNHCLDCWDSDTESEMLFLKWPFPDLETPKTQSAIIQHYAFCILKSKTCPESLTSCFSSIAKEYKKNETLTFDDLLQCSGGSEWTYLWDQVFESDNFNSDIAKMRASNNLQFGLWTLKPLLSRLKENPSSPDLKYLFVETFRLLTLPDKVVFFGEFLQENNSDSTLLRPDAFLEDVKLFMNKAGEYDFIKAQHDALVLALFSPKEFLDLLFKEVFSCGHKVFLNILVESLYTLLYRDEAALKEKCVGFLLSSSDEKFQENLSSVKVITERNPMNDFGLNLVNTAYNLFVSSWKPEGAYRLLSALRDMAECLSINNSPDILETLSVIYRDISAQTLLTYTTSRLQETILQIVRDHYGTSAFEDNTLTNMLHKRLRKCYLTKTEDETIPECYLVEHFVAVFPKATPSEWNILFQGLASMNAPDTMMCNVFKALSIIALEGNYDLYLFRQASLEISGFSNRYKSDHTTLMDLLKRLCMFLWVSRDRTDILPVWDVCLTSLINFLTEGSLKDEAVLKKICALLSFVPKSNGKTISLKKLEQLILSK